MSLDGKRRLSAIMFTDIAGFTAMAQQDESRALRLLEAQRKVMRPVFQRHSGTEVKTVGDAFLVEFDSALDAVSCALELQKKLNEGGSEPKVRIGIHLGDVVHAEADVYGDAVNLASRMESAAEPGGICISQQVYDQVKNKLDLGFERVDGVSLKNVKEPVAVYKLMTGQGTGAIEGGSDARRVAVLPLANFSPSQSDAYLADALTDELIASLSGIQGLHVIARTSVMQFKDSKRSVADISKTLGVGSVLQGSVLKSGDRIRINLQLVDPGSEEHIWTNKYDRKFEDIFEIQDDVARSVTESLSLKLTTTTVQPRGPGDIDAYTHCLRGRLHLYDRSEASLKAASDEFELALKSDPKYARAYAGLADATYLRAYFSFVPLDEAYARAVRLAKTATELDPRLAEPYATMGIILHFRDFAHQEAERMFRRAISMNPNYPVAHHWYAVMLSSMGRLEEALQQLALAKEADPLSVQVSVFRGVALAWAGRREEAEAEWAGVEGRTRGLFTLYLQRAVSRLDWGEGAEAEPDYERLKELTPESPTTRFVEGAIHAYAGDREGVLRVIEAYKSGEDISDVAMLVAVLLGMVGDNDGFFDWANRAVDGRHLEISSIRYMNWAKSVRSDPRYPTLLKRLNMA